MLSIRPYQRCTNSAVNNRMKPPRQISSTLCWSNADCKTASNAARSLPNGLLSIDTVGMPLAFAHARPIAPCEVEMTVIDHTMLARCRNHFAQQRNALAGFREKVGDLFDGVRF